MTKPVPQDMQDVIEEVSTTTSGRGDLANQYKVLDTIIEDSLKGVAYNDEYKAYDVMVQDQHTDIINYYLRIPIKTLAIATNTTKNAYTITVTDATGVVAQTFVELQQNTRAFQARILNVNGNILTLDTPLDYAYTTVANILNFTNNLAVDGSSTPVVTSIYPIAGYTGHITTILFAMTLTAAGADNLFGNLTALTKGIVLRKSNNIDHTIFNAKTNGDLALRMFDVSYTDRATPSQVFGLRGIFKIKERTGCVIKLDGATNDRLDLIIQDNLTSITSFRVVVQGHFEVGVPETP